MNSIARAEQEGKEEKQHGKSRDCKSPLILAPCLIIQIFIKGLLLFTIQAAYFAASMSYDSGVSPWRE
jgi:hypothetical protein